MTMTGYSSIDKPWEKLYPSKPLRDVKLNQKVWQTIEELNQGNLSNEAINLFGYAGNGWTYAELFRLVDCLAAAFCSVGVGHGDVVLVATVSGLDEALCFLALNKIGAVSKWVDVTISAGELREAITEDACRVAVVFAVVGEAIFKCLDSTAIHTVVWSSPEQFIRPFRVLSRSLSDFIRLVRQGRDKTGLPSMPVDPRFVSLDKFLKGGEGSKFPLAPFSDDEPALIIQSSGTTGKPKSIVHTDHSINAAIRKIAYTDLPLIPGRTMLKTVPSWVGYGLINSMATCLALGATLLCTPAIGESTIAENLGKFDLSFAVPLHLRYLAAHLDNSVDLHRITDLVTGGDKISREEIDSIYQQLSSLGLSAPPLNGAGNNEVLGVGLTNFRTANKLGTVGTPLFSDIISIFDPDTGEELTYGEVGEICYQTESAFLEYRHDPEGTASVKRLHADGKLWVHSGDLGSMDEDGYVTIEGRMARVITVAAFKISASHIEEALLTSEVVSDCVVVGLPDAADGEVPVAFVQLATSAADEESVAVELESLCRTRLKERAVPRHIHFLEKIPYTTNNKQDYRALEKLAKELYLGDD